MISREDVIRRYVHKFVNEYCEACDKERDAKKLGQFEVASRWHDYAECSRQIALTLAEKYDIHDVMLGMLKNFGD